AEIFALVERGDTVVMRTLSKAYGLAGARADWGYFPPEIAGEVRKLLNPNNISIPSQAMAAAAKRDQAHMQDVVAKTAAIRDGFAEGCRALGLAVPQSHTNFVLMRFASAEQAQAADTALRAEKLLMRAMGGYGLTDCLRATICSQEIMNRALAVLKGVLR
ncbi:MAG: aminotransferase class I/II-fold pyridoxal phosphate-dependent enzyme, partial [Leisingera sp.]